MAREKKGDSPAVDGGDNSKAVAGAQLRSYFDRVENLIEERQALNGDIRDIFREAKGNGFDPKIMRIVLRRRAMEAHVRAEQDALVHTYSSAVGTPSPVDAEVGDDS